MRVKVIKIKDNEGYERKDDYSKKRLNEVGYIYHLKVGDCLIFKYENKFKDHPFMLTTAVKNIIEDERFLDVITERSVYKFKKM